ncbi:MAG: bifunctional metallophosphatase/5'-nucleotidase [Pseudomonadota bacterium]
MRFFLWFSLSLALSSCVQPVHQKESNLKPIIIVHSNDIHGRAWPFIREDGKQVGGYAAQAWLVSKIRKEAKEKRAAFLLLSAGDVNTGVPESDFSEAEPDFKSMVRIGYDAMVVGNHDLDRGMELLLKQLSWVNFPFLASNLKLKTNHSLLFPSDVTLNREGLKFGIFGVTTDELRKLILPEHGRKLLLEDSIQTAQKITSKLKQSGSNIVIALSHLGVGQSGLSLHRYIFNDDRKLARSISDIDLVVGGHSHTFIENGIREGNALIVQAGYRGDHIGRIDMLWDTTRNQIVSSKAELLEVDPLKGEDNEIKNLLEPYRKKYEQELDVPVFETSEAILGQRNQTHNLEIPMGNLVCDALRTETQTDIAFFNSGGLRAGLPLGIVRRRHILEALPFKNLVSTGLLKGRDVIQLLNDGLQAGKYAGAVLQVSGLSYEIKSGKVRGVKIGKTPIELNKDYSFSTNSYVASGGDKLKAIRKARNLENSPSTVDEVLTSYLSKEKKIDTRIEGRILLKDALNQ